MLLLSLLLLFLFLLLLVLALLFDITLRQLSDQAMQPFSHAEA